MARGLLAMVSAAIGRLEMRAVAGGGPGAMSLQHALNSSSKFSHYWFLATCPGLLDMPRGSGLDCTNLAWLNSNNIGAEMETPEGRRGHDIFQHIDRIFRASGKVEAIRQLLAAARRDDSLPMGAPLRTTPKKKRACIFTARPGTAVALASWADKHLSRKWKVVVVLSKTSASRRQQVIDNAFQDIPCGDRALSTLFIASTGVCGVGINDLHKASHLIIAELRLRETDRSAC